MDGGASVLAPAERVAIPEAMRMVTTDAAFVVGLDDLVGSIEAGKFADFAVLTGDPLVCAPDAAAGLGGGGGGKGDAGDALRAIGVKATVMGGRVVDRAWRHRALEGGDPPPGFWAGIVWLMEKTSEEGSWARWFWCRVGGAMVRWSANGHAHAE